MAKQPFKRELISVKEFRRLGLLHEVNRQFLHPLGLALEVTLKEDGEEFFSAVWDSRDDPEGISFFELDEGLMKKVQSMVDARHPERVKRLGYWIQSKPIMDNAPEPTPIPSGGATIKKGEN